MPARRPLATALSAGALLLALTGCEKPTPGVTLASGGTSVHSESTLYCHSAADLASQTCSEHTDRVTVLPVVQGALVGIDVDSSISDKGWYVVDADANQRSAVQDEHYFTINADFSDRPVKNLINLEVRSLDRVAEDGAQVLGVWKFQLVQK